MASSRKRRDEIRRVMSILKGVRAVSILRRSGAAYALGRTFSVHT